MLSDIKAFIPTLFRRHERFSKETRLESECFKTATAPVFLEKAVGHRISRYLIEIIVIPIDWADQNTMHVSHIPFKTVLGA